MTRRIFYILCMFLLLMTSCSRQEAAAEAEPVLGTSAAPVASEPADYVPQTLAQEYFFAMGNYLAANYSRSFDDMDMQAFVAGILSFESGNEMSYEQIDEVVSRYYDDIMQRIGGENRRTAEAFLEENGQREGVVTTPSGLQYTVMREGEGPRPAADSTVSVIYTLTLLDGTVVDTSSGNAVSFPVSGVIPGFAEAVMQMNSGSSIRAWIHPDLGYGDGTQSIEPQSLLIFDIELVSFE